MQHGTDRLGRAPIDAASTVGAGIGSFRSGPPHAGALALPRGPGRWMPARPGRGSGARGPRRAALAATPRPGRARRGELRAPEGARHERLPAAPRRARASTTSTSGSSLKASDGARCRTRSWKLSARSAGLSPRAIDATPRLIRSAARVSATYSSRTRSKASTWRCSRSSSAQSRSGQPNRRQAVREPERSTRVTLAVRSEPLFLCSCARWTHGNSSPLDPCTVMTRTASREASSSCSSSAARCSRTALRSLSVRRVASPWKRSRSDRSSLKNRPRLASRCAPRKRAASDSSTSVRLRSSATKRSAGSSA